MKISVVLALYGRSIYLKDQLNSLKVQTRKLDELIIVVDYNRYESWRKEEILEMTQPMEASIYFNSANIGPANTFAFGSGNTSGDIVLFCDQDDIWEKCKLDKIEKIYTSNTLIYHDAKVFSDDMQIYSKLYAHEQNLSILSILLRNKIVGCTIAVDGRWLRRIIKSNSLEPMHDWIIVLLAKIHGLKLNYSSEELMYYRRHPGTATVLNNKFSLKRVLKFRIILLKSLIRIWLRLG